jgi:acetylglutamate kinase
MTSIVVKVGGHALDSLHPTSPVLVDLAADITQLHSDGTTVVVVHGGGPQIATLLADVGLEGQFHQGLRVTSPPTMRYVSMALSEVNMAIVSSFNQSGLVSVGLSGTDGSVLCAAPLGGVWGRVAAVPKVRADVITSLWDAHFTPVMTSIAVDDEGGLLNCNADTAAGVIASSLGAVLVLLSDVDQLRRDPGDETTGVERITMAQLLDLVASGSARDGMRPKGLAALDALEGGARSVLIANGTRPHALANALARSIPTTEVVR